MAELPTGTITFLFTDIEGSTRLWEQHPAAMEGALTRHDALATAIIEQHSGILVKHRGEGDSLFAVFARARDAVLAAADLQRALVTEPWAAEVSLSVRMALHTGDATARTGDYYGAAVNRCARLRAAAHGGQLLLSATTQELVQDDLPSEVSLRDLGLRRLRDLQRAEHIFQLLHPDLPGDFPPLQSLDVLPNNLPQQMTRFIGREQEMAEVRRLLAHTRLLTLTGSGGCGKTRLALQVAADSLEEYADGVWLVELAPLSDPALVPQAVVAALGVPEQPGHPLAQTLAEYLRPKSLLLLLDNCEHLLLASAELVESLLKTCRHLRVLASSREPLRVAGETPWRIRSLALPDSKRLPPLESLAHFDAVSLFLDRASTFSPGFTLTAANAAAVVRICQRLDGIPLALELAAARLRALPVEQIEARLDDMYRLLTGGSRTALPRQQTLRALIDWSYHLLSDPERMLLRRLSVFAGGWTLEAAEAICADAGSEADPPATPNPRSQIQNEEVLDLLTSLVDKSLVVYDASEAEERYRLPETIRQYARETLLEAGEEEKIRQQHGHYYLALVEGSRGRKWRLHTGDGLSQLEREHDNLRVALAWFQAEPDGEPGLQLGVALARLWNLNGHWTEGRGWLEAALARPGAERRTVLRARALHGAGFLAQCQGDYAAAHAHHTEALAIAREAGHQHLVGLVLCRLANNALVQGDLKAARSLAEESVAILTESGETGNLFFPLLCLGDVARAEGDSATARTIFERSLGIAGEAASKLLRFWAVHRLGHLTLDQEDPGVARSLAHEGLTLARDLGFRRGIGRALWLLGKVTGREGDSVTARRLYGESLVLFQELGARPEICENLEGLAGIAAAEGMPERAARLLGAATALRETISALRGWTGSADRERQVSALREMLGDERFTAAWAEGTAMPLEEAIAYALEASDQP